MILVNRQPAETNEKEYLQRLSQRMDELAINLEKMGIAEYVAMLNNPRRLLFINFLSGMARGFGMAIGFTILAAIFLYFLQKIVVLNMPLIGDFIADIVNIVQNQLQAGGTVFH